ncbi:MAG: hypothetical protein IJ863_01925 [Spirochaetales bacterium]|nr:hypothetical protein [Spirochaetales bacterium]
MKKKHFHFAVFLIVVMLVILAILLLSCSVAHPDRRIEVTIPEHPWEVFGGVRLWYTLKWTYGDSLRSLYIPSDVRKVSISVPVGETVLVAAYPLGEMNPYGGSVTPLDSSMELVLSQNDGSIVGELLDIDRMMTVRLNYRLLSERMREKVDDFRLVSKVPLLRDLQNGELLASSIKVSTTFAIDSFSLPNGMWVSEFLRDSSLVVTNGFSGDFELPEGVFRYLNAEMGRELVIIVDSSGASYSYLRQSMV